MVKNDQKWPFWPLRSIWGVWKWSQWISHAQKPWDRHQNQVSSMFRTKVRNFHWIFWNWPKMAKNGHFGHSGQSEVSENGPNEFLMPKNLGRDAKNKYLAGSEPKLPVWPCFLILTDRNGQKWPFGHSGQSEVPENGPNGFLIPKNLGIDTKIKSLACSEPKLEIWPDFFGTNFRIAKKCLNIALIQKLRALSFLQFYPKFHKMASLFNICSYF